MSDVWSKIFVVICMYNFHGVTERRFSNRGHRDFSRFTKGDPSTEI